MASPKKKASTKTTSEFRRDLVSKDWVVIATGRARRPHAFAPKKRDPEYVKREGCPFEDFGTATHVEPLLVYDRGGRKCSGVHAQKDWFVQVVPNKFPAFTPVTPHEWRRGPFSVLTGSGYHEVLISRDHARHWGKYTADEAGAVFKAYHERFSALSDEKFVQYVSIFHNFGSEVGASIYHPHSQIIAIPVIPPDVARSFSGSSRYFNESGRCVHCDLLAYARKTKKRIIAENSHFTALCPFASRTSFEVRILPRRHISCFGDATQEELRAAGNMLRRVLAAFRKNLGDPSYNFFIHTSPCRNEFAYPNYHWHIEIIPKISIWAGFEVATGIEISTIAPEQAAAFLRAPARSAK